MATEMYVLMCRNDTTELWDCWHPIFAGTKDECQKYLDRLKEKFRAVVGSLWSRNIEYANNMIDDFAKMIESHSEIPYDIIDILNKYLEIEYYDNEDIDEIDEPQFVVKNIVDELIVMERVNDASQTN